MKKLLLLFAFLFAFNANASTIPEGAIVKAPSSPDVYIIKYSGGNSYKRLILNPKVFESYGHLKWSNLITISDEELAYQYINSDLVRVDGDTQIYQLIPYGDTGTKTKIAPGFTYNPNSVYTINSVDFNNYGSTETVTVPSVATPKTISSPVDNTNLVTQADRDRMTRAISIYNQMKIVLQNNNDKIDSNNQRIIELSGEIDKLDNCDYILDQVAPMDAITPQYNNCIANYNSKRSKLDSQINSLYSSISKLQQIGSEIVRISYEVEDYVEYGTIIPASDRAYLLSLGISV